MAGPPARYVSDVSPQGKHTQGAQCGEGGGRRPGREARSRSRYSAGGGADDEAAAPSDVGSA